MNTHYFFYASVLVFALLIIGLVLTFQEFRDQNKKTVNSNFSS